MKDKAKGFHWALLILIGLLAFSPRSAKGFALLGPIQPWMQFTNGVTYPGDIGGPMELTNEYRWNVPVVTYGFDQSFLDFFGTNGVAAVEGAIQMLNDLPPASQMVLTNYPFDSRQVNYAAQSQSLLDLKSEALSFLLQQLGLAQPTRNIYVIKQWDPVLANYSGVLLFDVFEGTNLSNYVSALNYDPQSLEASPYVNQTLYSGQIYDSVYQHAIGPFSVDPLADTYNAVADFSAEPGACLTFLTYDDVGGLRYLLSTNNVNYETLLPDVCGIGTNADSYVNGAWRPGVNKITFVPQPINSSSGAFQPMTNIFTDTYITNGISKHQELARVTLKPDFLFSAKDMQTSPSVSFADYTRTENWLNEATLNGNTNGAGPGVIQPPIQITFNRLGRLYVSESYYSENQAIDYSAIWGSFNGSTNQPVIFPDPGSGTNQLTVRLYFVKGTYPNQSTSTVDCKSIGESGTPFTFQTSTNLINWTNLFTITNNGTVCTYANYTPASSSRFYRLIRQ